MLTFERRKLDSETKVKVMDWLLKPEAELFLKCLSAEIAVHQVNAASVVQRCTNELSDKAGLDSMAAASIKQAAILQTCVNVIREAQAADVNGREFISAEVKVV
jgi:hypothetical protein